MYSVCPAAVLVVVCIVCFILFVPVNLIFKTPDAPQPPALQPNGTLVSARGSCCPRFHSLMFVM